jgi:hypothetical protein
MKEIIKEETYSLYEDEKGELWIEVLCGSIGLYEVLVKLLPDEVNLYRKRSSFLDDLAFQISKDPDKYKNR